MTNGRRITMKDVASALGVSGSTVSLALRGDARISASVQRSVKEEAKRLGYRLSLNGAILSQAHPKIIGVVANFEQELHSAYVKEMQAIAPKSGFCLMAENASMYDNPADALEKLSQFQVETILAIDPPASLCANDLKPAVVIAQSTSLPTANLVISDSSPAAAELAKHLHSLGHRNVIYLDGPKGVSGNARRKIITKAMSFQGIEMQIWQAGNTLEAGFVAMQQLLTRIWSEKDGLSGRRFDTRCGVLGRTTAIVCYNDQCAQGAYIALLKAGVSVPRDVSLAGFDNSAVGAGKAFQLTSIDRNRKEVSVLAFELACARQERKLKSPVRRTVASRLIIRKSTGEANYLSMF